jgi:hypothetical protein
MRNGRFFVSALVAAAIMAVAAPSAWADDLVGTQERSEDLFFFDSDDPREVEREDVDGLDEGEDLLGVDVRPATGGLYVLGDHGNLYVVNRNTMDAAKVASLPIELNAVERDVHFALDFNPASDRLRVITDADENWSVNPDTGAVTIDGKLQYHDDDDSPEIVAAAYTNPPPSGQAAVINLFAIDARRNALFQVAPPASGVLSEQETLDINVRHVVGLDIGHNNRGFLVTTSEFGKSELFELDLVTGDVSEANGLDKEDNEIGFRGLNGVATLNQPQSVPATTAPTTPPPTTPPATP